MESGIQFKQNLLDAGCSGRSADNAEQLYTSGQLREALLALRAIRCDLMDELHTSQRKVDCLDYLIRQTEKEFKITSERKIHHDEN